MSTTTLKSSKFVCVEYPAIVKNVDAALESLGGPNRITKTYQDPSLRLEVRFRTSDLVCKPCFADRVHTTNLLIRVIRRRKKHEKNAKFEVSAEVLGTVKTCYKFSSLADFQYVSMQKLNGEYRSCLSELAPQKLEGVEWINKDASLFILPPLFSRMDSAGDYHFRKDPTGQHSKKDESSVQNESQTLITRMRQRRIAYAQLVTFEDKEIPTKALDGAYKFCPDNIQSNREMLEAVTKLFELRPIWSRNAISGESSYKHGKLKTVLPVLAYYFYNGPWRGLWCRFGYDPRFDKTAMIYQNLDFRTKFVNLSKTSIKRSSVGYILPNKLAPNSARVATIQKEMLKASDNLDQNSDDVAITEDAYRFRVNRLPVYRQMFYQFCDIEVEEIQNMVADKRNHSNDCHERYGWLIPSVHKKCRAILADCIKKCMLQNEDQQAEASITEEDEEEESEDEFINLQSAMESELMEYDDLG